MPKDLTKSGIFVEENVDHTMKTVSVSNLPEYLNQPMWNSDSMIYRGVPNEKFQLIPSVGRFDKVDPADLELYEKRVLADFRRRALPFLREAPKTLLEWMFLAQHYGVPTRLLDWTTNPLVALYFAVSSQQHLDANFAVYCTVHTQWLNDPACDSPMILDHIVAVMPPHFDVRMVNQEGLFTIHPHPRLPYTSSSLLKIVFDCESRVRLKWELRKLGYGPARVFPGLDGIAGDVVDRQQYLLEGGAIEGSINYGFKG